MGYSSFKLYAPSLFFALCSTMISTSFAGPGDDEGLSGSKTNITKKIEAEPNVQNPLSLIEELPLYVLQTIAEKLSFDEQNALSLTSRTLNTRMTELLLIKSLQDTANNGDLDFIKRTEAASKLPHAMKMEWLNSMLEDSKISLVDKLQISKLVADDLSHQRFLENLLSSPNLDPTLGIESVLKSINKPVRRERSALKVSLNLTVSAPDRMIAARLLTRPENQEKAFLSIANTRGIWGVIRTRAATSLKVSENRRQALQSIEQDQDLDEEYRLKAIDLLGAEQRSQ